MPAAIGTLVLAHLFDLISFLEMIGRHGLAAEANPVVVMIADQIGLVGLTVAKAASVGVGASVFALLVPQRRRLALAVLMFGVGAGLLGGLSNVATW